VSSTTTLIVPATVPDAHVLRTQRTDPAAPILASAAPARVAAPLPVPVVSDHITAEHVAELRRDLEALRRELARLRAT
jgi:hypothetical protein